MVNYVVSDTSDFELKSRTCYICGVDLLQQYKKDNNNKQNDLNASTQKFPEMIRWDGQKKELCSSCYKSVDEGLAVYQAAHPDWQRPTSREW